MNYDQLQAPAACRPVLTEIHRLSGRLTRTREMLFTYAAASGAACSFEEVARRATEVEGIRGRMAGLAEALIRLYPDLPGPTADALDRLLF